MVARCLCLHVAGAVNELLVEAALRSSVFSSNSCVKDASIDIGSTHAIDGAPGSCTGRTSLQTSMRHDIVNVLVSDLVPADAVFGRGCASLPRIPSL